MGELEQPVQKGRKVLIVDDQPMMCKAIRRMLSGHEVTAVGDAREALARLQAGERFDLIISDLMMPEMTGMDLHAAVAAFAPDQVSKMVFMTGGAFTEHGRRFFDQVDCPTIEKPFDKARLLAVVGPLLA